MTLQLLLKFVTGDFVEGAIDIAALVQDFIFPNCSDPDTDIFTITSADPMKAILDNLS